MTFQSQHFPKVK